jgi:regulator of replication initiation timing
MSLDTLNLLESKIKDLLSVVKDLTSENKRLKLEIERGEKMGITIDEDKKSQIRTKIEEMLDLLEEF